MDESGHRASGIAGGLVVTLFALVLVTLVSGLALAAAGGSNSFIVPAACASAGFLFTAALLLRVHRGPVPLRSGRDALPPSLLALGLVLAANLVGTWTGESLGETYTGGPEIPAGVPAAAGIFFMAVVVAPAAEELFFREVLLARVLAGTGRWTAVAVTAACFGLFHLSAGGAVLVATMILIGTVLGWLRLRTGSLGPPFLVHALNNAVALAFLS